VPFRAVASATLVAVTSLAACGGAGNDLVRVVVPPGVSLAIAADSLASAGVISWPRLFRMYASVTGQDRQVKPGTYQLARDASWKSVLRSLVEGRGLVYTVTVPEGWELSSIIEAISRATEMPPESLEAAVRDSSLRQRLTVPTPTLEGYLFPETYTIPHGSRAHDVIRAMVQEFERRWKPEWTARLQTLEMTRHDIVTLASIVEKEARVAEERSTISGVYHNRLRIGMPLQADPTVQYALGRHVERVLFRDLKVDSRYNTYRYAGLPPGPIASPGAPSIEAALYPDSVPWLYFVARPDGRHEFRRTHREHLQAIARIRTEHRASRQDR
jgi:UPF0755 protein